ncbi:hypothetical protein CIL05_05850 [Virgibacillus profundi]|uniref:DUF456 domain-containing protein n=1 Tax=Virgibacillus profundi TaxID=2024555 RepID=A0A2A2IHA1_9BACI|nr:DUF456 domain-containing protein [Virgibacillus profundi]PAV30624.1 hypothetical protein CIL05_05850 [Virgibacillus profundi]PXY54796.1 DUF456 domain-containing protein [Virgibacillus profundi]
MLDIIIWIVIIALFIISFAGIVFPIIPSVLVLWVGFILYHFVINSDELNFIFWLVMGVFTVVLIVADIIANSYFVKKFGGSKWGERGAAVAVIVGSFIIPPFGILIIPFAVVFIIEMLQKRTTKEAFRASIGSLMGFLGGAFAKVVIQIVMIVWFFIVILL